MFVLHVLSVDINISYVNVKIHRTLINGSLTCKRFDHMLRINEITIFKKQTQNLSSVK